MRKAIVIGMCLLMMGCVRIDEVIGAKPSEPKETKEPELQDEDTKQRIFVCTNEAKEEITFEAVGDQLKTMNQVFYMDFADVGITENMDKDQMEKAINDSLSRSYGEIEGVDVHGALEESHVKITIHIDYEKADANVLIQEGLLHEGEKETQYISLRSTLEDYDGNGYACVQE